MNKKNTSIESLTTFTEEDIKTTQDKKELSSFASFSKKITALIQKWENKFKHNLPKNYTTIEELSESELTELRERIKTGFLDKNQALHKGASEVYNALTFKQISPDQKIYVVNHLDLHYEEALIRTYCEMGRNLQIKRIPKKYIGLVHDCIKDINQYSNKIRLEPRRYFNCRLFLV